MTASKNAENGQSSSPAPSTSALFGTEDRIDPEGILRAALGRAPTEEELILWAGMPADRRVQAVKRIEVLRRWTDAPPGEMTAAEAANEIGSAVSRFYEIASTWSANKTLASIGSFAKKSGSKGMRLDGEAVNIIQSLLPGLMKAEPRAKIAAIVRKLESAEELKGKSLPHSNTLRTMVEREKRRLMAESQVGARPGFDVTACDLLREDGRHHLFFATVDRTSGYILGFSVGRLSESRQAYGRAAQDALDRIGRDKQGVFPWADDTTRIDVIAGDDGESWKRVKFEYDANRFGPDFGVVATGRRFGRYLKIVAGDSIGDMKIFPHLTEQADPVGNEVTRFYTDAEAMVTIEAEVARHNNRVRTASGSTGAPRPAPVTLRILELIAAGAGQS